MKRTSRKHIKNKIPNKETKKVSAVEKTKTILKKRGIGNFTSVLEQFGNKNIFLLLFMILITGIFAYFSYFTLDSLFFFKDIGSDSVNQDYPALVHKVTLMKEGFMAKWSFYQGMGKNYFTGFPTDPYSWLSVGIDRIGYKISGENYFVYARFYKIFFFNILTTGLIFFFYLQSIKLDKFTSVVGGFLISFSGYFVLGSTWGFAGEVFRGVFLLFAFEQFLMKKRWYFFPFAIVFLSGNLFNLYIYSVFLLVYSILRLYLEQGFQPKKASLFLLKLGGLGALGLGMNAVNALRGFLKMFYSPRVSGNATLTAVTENAVDYSTHYATLLLRFFSNDILGNGSNFKGWYNYLEAPVFYVGLLALLLVPQFFTFLKKEKRIVHGVFLCFWLLVAFVSPLRHAFYLFMGDYFRIGLDFILPFVLLFYAMHALHNIIKQKRINPFVLGISAVVLLVFLYFPYSSLAQGAIDTDLQKKVTLFIIADTIIIFMLAQQSFFKLAQYALLVSIVFEAGFSAHTTSAQRKTYSKAEFKKSNFGYADGTKKAVKFLKSYDTGFYRIEKDYQSGNSQNGSLNDGMAQNYYGTTCYSSFNQLNYVRFLEESGLIKKGDETATRWIVGLRGRPILQTFANVKYNLSNTKKTDFLRFGYDSIANFGNIKVLKNKFYLPFGFTYSKSITSEEFNKLDVFGKQLSFISAFVLEKEFFKDKISSEIVPVLHSDSSIFVPETKFNFSLYKNAVEKLKEDTFEFTKFTQSKIEGNITLKKDKLLFFTIPFDEGWQISVNGKPQALSRVNFGFSGLQLHAGAYNLVLTYTPPYFLVSIVSSFVFLLVYLLLFFILYFMKNKFSHSTKK